MEEVNAAFARARRHRAAGGHPPVHEDPIVSTDIVTSPVLVDLRRGADDGGGRPPREGRVLVRQRVGLLQPAGRPGGARPRAGAALPSGESRQPRRDAEKPQRSRPAMSTGARRVLVRVDFNVPLDGRRGHRRRAHPRGAAHDRAAAWTRARALVLCSHLGRPKGRDPETSLTPVSRAPVRADRRAGARRRPRWSGPEVRRGWPQSSSRASVLVLENTRWEPGETKNDPELAARAGRAGRRLRERRLRRGAPRARLHRRAWPECLRPAVAGCLLEREVTDARGPWSRTPERPLVVVLGGAKVTDKIALIDRFLDMADTLLIGGAMCFSFFRAQGTPPGDSLVEEEGVELARAGAGARPSVATAACCCRSTSCWATASPRTPSAASSTASTCPTAGWASTSGRAPSAAYAARDRAAPARCSGTARWARSSWSRSPAARARVAEAVAAAPGTTVVGGGDSRRGAGLVRPGRPGRPPVHRRRRVARAARGQARCRGGGARRCLSRPPGDHRAATGRCASTRGRGRRAYCRRPAGLLPDREPTRRTWRSACPFTALWLVRRQAARAAACCVFAQNMHQEPEGAFTGEISRADAHRAGRGRRGARPLRAAAVLRRDRPRAPGQGARRAGRRPRADPRAWARPRRSASSGETERKLRHQVQEGLEKRARRATWPRWWSPTSRSGRSAPARWPPPSRRRRRSGSCARWSATARRRPAERMRVLYGGSVKPDNARRDAGPAGHRRRAGGRREPRPRVARADRRRGAVDERAPRTGAASGRGASAW